MLKYLLFNQIWQMVSLMLLRVITLLMIVLIALMLTACSTSKIVPQVQSKCPQIPALPQEFKTVDVNALELTEQSFKDYINDNL